MNRQFETLDMQADRLAEEALHEVGDEPFDEADDYTRQCDYAGCYRRGDLFEKRRQMMTDWAAWCEKKKADNVRPIRSKKAA